ncbi:MAG: hypothetical protein M3Y89_18490 [Actinomycetota bacterium]|nr:hypothetical protein [Actinomycetota bacterium]
MRRSYHVHGGVGSPKDTADPGRSFVTLTQAVSSAPEVARALREFLIERVWAHRSDTDEEATARTAALVSSQLLGAAWARYVVRMEPFASASRAQVAAWIGPTIEAYITGRLGTAQTASQLNPDDHRSRRQAGRRGT